MPFRTTLLLLKLLAICAFGMAQNSFRNLGKAAIHPGGHIGFYVNFVNDGIFNENKGLAGFYGPWKLSASGTNMPVFSEMEIALESTLELQIPIAVERHINFIFGNIIAAGPAVSNVLDIRINADHNGASDISKVTGYVQSEGKSDFLFPVGSEELLRPLFLESEVVNDLALCAYFATDPMSFPLGNFSTANLKKSDDLLWVSPNEFWHLETGVPAAISVSWNEDSGFDGHTDNIDQISLAGWNRIRSQWEPIPLQEKNGTPSEGFLKTVVFETHQYQLFTFGLLNGADLKHKPGNYLVSPNGDGLNDSLIIEGTELLANNRIIIFDRYGLKVFEHTNYHDEFEGVCNVSKIVPNRGRGLPSGVYFYLLYPENRSNAIQGYFYLTD